MMLFNMLFRMMMKNAVLGHNNTHALYNDKHAVYTHDSIDHVVKNDDDQSHVAYNDANSKQIRRGLWPQVV